VRAQDILAVWPADHARIHFRPCVKRLEVFYLLRAVRAISARPKATATSPRTLQQGATGAPFAIEHTAVSCAIFSPGTGIRFLQVATPLGPVDIELSTRLFDGWGSVQHGVVAITKGFAEGAADVSGALGPLLEDLLSILSLSANAWVGSPRAASSEDCENDLAVVHAKVCDTAPLDPRELSEVATGALLDRIAAHPSAKLLWKIAGNYRRALAHWDQQSTALSHLHEGFLAMSDVLISFLCEARGLTTAELADEYRVRTDRLSTHVLKAELYQDDVVCLQAAQAAWHRANSGNQQAMEEDDFAPDDAHVTAARYLRSSVIRVAELEDRYRSVLLTSPYDVPLGASQETERQLAHWEPGSRSRAFARGPHGRLERGSQI
jgi:hypothetical protein